MLPRTPLPEGLPTQLRRPSAAGPSCSRAITPRCWPGWCVVQPVFNQGKLAGYRIFPGGAHGTEAFSQLGLKPGDLILAINGTSLDDPTQALAVLQTLSSSGSASVTVSRKRDVAGGQSEPRQLEQRRAKLTALAREAFSRRSGPIGPTIRRRPLGLPAANAYGAEAGGADAAMTGRDARSAPTREGPAMSKASVLDGARPISTPD